MHKKYSIGIDFGTLSARAILIDNTSGEEIMSSIYGYQDAVMDRYLKNSDQRLPIDYALQNPMDYRDAVVALLKDISTNSGVDAEDIISIGLDFTACTILPVDKDMIPLCLDSKFADDPHAWVKLWKHHGAQKEADIINATAKQRGEDFLKYYGNTSSSEWMFAKVLETYRQSPQVYDAAYRFVEAGDWVVWALTGKETTSTCMAGYKAFWNEKDGYPGKDYLEAVEPGFSSILDKLTQKVMTVGERAGGLTTEMALATGLKADTSVAVSMIDAHAAMPVFNSLGLKNALMMAMGTSICHILISDTEVFAEGISGVVKDGIIPGYYGYEAGQAAVGDIYSWFIDNLASNECYKEASKRNISPHTVMDEKVKKLKPGQNGLIALDWWNGNRSMLNNSKLSGMLVGMTLGTTQEEIYRAIIESTAFGTRNIIEAMEKQGIKIENIYACGGLSRKSQVVMQIFADIIGKEITTVSVEQTTAFGAAMYGMVAAGRERGGYDSFEEMAEALKVTKAAVFTPDAENHRIYDKLFEYYLRLTEYFGVTNRDIMEDLKDIQDR